MGALGGAPAIIRDPLFLLAFFFALVALGRRVTRIARISLTALTRSERGFVYATLGAGVAQHLPFTLALLGHLSVFAVRTAALLVAGLLLPDLIAVMSAVMKAAASLRRQRPSGATSAWAVMLAIFLGVLLVRAVIIGAIGDDDGTA